MWWKMTEGELFMRYATSQDYSGVVNIDAGYVDGDYIPSRYHDYLMDPKRHMMVYLLGDQIVGFYMLYEVDDGETLVGQSSRLIPSVRSKGLWRLARTKALETVLKKKPHLKEFAYTFEEDHPGMLRPPRELIMVLHELSLTMTSYLCFPSLNSSVKSKLSSGSAKYTYIHLTEDTFPQALTQPELVNQLFPFGTVVVDWEPFKLNKPGNIGILGDRISKNELAVVGRKSTQNDSGKQYESLSFCTTFSISNGVGASLEYYGSSSEDVLLHLLEHLRRLKEKWVNGKLSITLYAPAVTLCKDNLKKVMEGLPGMEVEEQTGKAGSPLKLQYGTADIHKLLESWKSRLLLIEK